MKEEEVYCKRCNSRMVPGYEIENTAAKGLNDLAGDDDGVCTMHYGGLGLMIRCVKCPDCGYSMYR